MVKAPVANDISVLASRKADAGLAKGLAMDGCRLSGDRVRLVQTRQKLAQRIFACSCDDVQAVPMKAKKADWISLIEAGYSLDGSDQQWLDHVFECAKPLFDSGAGQDGWLFPANTTEPAITLRAVEDGARFIEVAGTGFTPAQSVKLGYDIFSGGGPTFHQTGEETLTSAPTGAFIDRIQVNNSGDISGAQVEATDVASGMTAEASI